MVEGQQQVGVCFVLLEDSQEVQPLLAFLTAAVMLSVQEISVEMRMTRNQKLWTLSTKGGAKSVLCLLKMKMISLVFLVFTF